MSACSEVPKVAILALMAWHLRFWRRVRVAPGVSVNMSKSGPSVSVGPRGAKLTVGRRGIRRTIGIPGTGIYATNQESWKTLQAGQDVPAHKAPDPAPTAATRPGPRQALLPRASQAQPCGFCGGVIGPNGRCGMCAQPAERWRNG
jgi:hypothetical protein